MSAIPPRRLEARLRFRQLEVVRAIAEAGSVRGAAERLALSAPAVSKALAETEHALGCELFTRLPRGMAPTPRGERILSHARLLLNELDYFLSDAITGEGVNQGLLRLGASPYVGNRILPALPVASLVLIYRRISADFLQGVQELREAARQLPA
ncbi:MAG: LysR family transcriptional regulator [Pigmentiphaga sp.]|nr:LysR family transcriptional regulator [Pigmentiphaga sp.]